MSDKPYRILLIAAACLICACGRSGTEAPAEPAASPAEPEAAGIDLAAVLDAGSRSAEDRARDAGRKPAEVLEFLGIEPGIDVIDLMAAGGWYSEVLSLAVGPDGSVTAQNPPFMLAFRDGAYGTALDERIGDRLSNVTRLNSTWEELAAGGEQYDFALSALNMHDTYYMQSPAQSAAFATAVFAALRPGGIFGVIDHVGNPDGDNKTLHRIDKDLAISILTSAGFVLEDESDMLANPDDDHMTGVFSEGIRGKTDRFLLRLRKPSG